MVKYRGGVGVKFIDQSGLRDGSIRREELFSRMGLGL